MRSIEVCFVQVRLDYSNSSHLSAPTLSPVNISTLQKSRPPTRYPAADLGLANDDADVASRLPESALDDDMTLHHPDPTQVSISRCYVALLG